ncbi:MAG: hypothetical protein KA020_07300 [Planctomycetes bacterium]|nr:hypothetical protein [Planctomycetota bacterium]
MRMFFRCCALLGLNAVLAAQSPLTTGYYGGNSGALDGAVYFDLTAQAPLSVTGLDVHLTGNGFGVIDIYRCPGTYASNETNAAAWTLVGTGTVHSLGLYQASFVTLASPIALPVGRNGYACVASGGAFAYTNAGFGIPLTYATEELQLDTGAASNVPFVGPRFAPRIVNTTIYYAPVGANFARRTDVGTGCVQRTTSFYELFAGTSRMDLAFQAFRLVPRDGGYTVIAGGAWRPLSAAAVPLGLVDESQAIRSFAGVFDHPGGSTTSFEVGSNGTVSAGPNNFGSEVDPAVFLDRPFAAWVVWRDFVPTSFGNVWWEEGNGVVTVTWLDVLSYQSGGLGFTPSRFQLQFDTNTDEVTYVFQSMDSVGSSWTWLSNDYLVGYSPGGLSLDPGSIDLTAAGFSCTVHAADAAALHLAASARPIQSTGLWLSMQNVPAGAILGGLAFGLANPGVDLTALGMPGCVQHTDLLAAVLFPVSAAGPVVVPITVPSAIGTVLHCQAFVYDPTSGLTPLGAIASQGLQLLIGSF